MPNRHHRFTQDIALTTENKDALAIIYDLLDFHAGRRIEAISVNFTCFPVEDTESTLRPESKLKREDIWGFPYIRYHRRILVCIGIQAIDSLILII